eukprot:gene11731-11875_t
MWLPPWSSRLAAQVLQEVGGDLATRGVRPVVFWTFSGAAKKDRLSPGQAELSSLLLRCAVGQVYDSGPVDFTSEAVSVRR